MHLFCNGHASLFLQLQLSALVTCVWFFLIDRRMSIQKMLRKRIPLHPLSYTITGGAARQEKVKPKTWRISASADAIWFLRLQVFTTDQPRCYAFDKVLPPLVFTEKNYGFPVFGTKLQEKILFFRLLTQELVKIVRKCFF